MAESSPAISNNLSYCQGTSMVIGILEAEAAPKDQTHGCHIMRSYALVRRGRA